MSFKAEVSRIRNAAKGKEVKESIANALENAYSESINKGNTDAEVIAARGTFPSLKSRISSIDNQIGILDNLNVNNKKSIVDAINEIANKIVRRDWYSWLRWIECSKMPRQISQFGIGATENSILIWNGITNTGHSGKMFEYRTDLNTWNDITDNGDFDLLLNSYISQEGSASFKYNNENYILSIGGYSDKSKKRRTEITKITKTSAVVIGYMNYARQNPSCVYENGKVYITGGYTDDECFCNKVEVFDLATKQTTILPPLPISVNGYLTSSVKDGKLYIFESRLTTNNNNYILDLSNNSYDTFAKSSLQTTHLCKAVDYGDYIILLGGYDNMLVWYDIVHDKYIDKSTATSNVKAWCTPIADLDGFIYLFGGRIQSDDGNVVVDSVYSYLAVRDQEEIDESDI